jgi:predicted PurR-regulated permease PerM
MIETVPAPQPEAAQPSKAQRLAGVAAGLGLVAVAVWMLTTFLPALAWATVLAIATWPLFVAARERAGRTWAAAAVTLLVAVVVIAPLVVAAIQAAQEFRAVIRWYIDSRQAGIEAPEWLANLPLIGASLADWLNSRLQDERGPISGADVRSLTEWGRIIGAQAARRATTLLFALLIVFFIFRESEALLRQFRAVGSRLLGPPAPRLGSVAATAVRGTVDGLLLVGIGEAVLLGIAYTICGVPQPSLLGVITGVLSAIPFASPLVFIGAAVWLLMQSATVAAIGLLAFGSLVVFVADHFARPVLIGGSTRLPFVWVLLGILGGVESFGLLGLFLGPALLAVLITLWRELADSPPGK